ncbi:up-regulator of cell proliferation-like [Triplophysa dalaica]|uniref:up-regulator of cell proliferation-like n=1 Tax=Triplophysa dalaica TaxID=1582913 RepID=UPI0024DF7400|nr:up-regulator of cell proliferation-like [Triplophysa dalaica]
MASKHMNIEKKHQEPEANEQGTMMKKLLENLGLAEHYNKKLTLSTVLQLGRNSVSEVPVESLSDLPWLLMKRLMMLKRTARSVKCSSSNEAQTDDSEWNDDQESDESDNLQSVNALDILTALFLCSDSFLQQEMILKMSMCQFSVPLLLPNSDENKITLMLWAMRDVVKKYRPHSLKDQSAFVEERIVLSELPLVSFVRLGRCSISKSEILNKLLSNPQQYIDTFVHFNMDCGNIQKKISNGLVEISWYLPCGNRNIDVFPEPVAIANLRGDIQDFETQYSFLCKASTAVFVFFDHNSLDTENILVPSQTSALKLFYVGDSNNEGIKSTVKKLNLNKSNFIFKAKQNDADFVGKIRTKLQEAVVKNNRKMSGVHLAEVAKELGILVDEDAEECQSAKACAEEITSKIEDIVQFKKTELPLQGEILLELAKLEKEQCRLKKAGDQSIENYKSDLQMKIKELRKKQNTTEMSDTMSCFISAISRPDRAYFIKWLRIFLENLSHKVLPGLREMYKQKCQDVVGNKEEIAELDKRISNSSLGIEHFMREMSQLYEASVLHLEGSPYQKQLEKLPRLCAGLLFDGFPLELVDGDASNVPVTWLTSVLSELNTLVMPNNKIVVVTVLGVQSSGKSTLLNTMFGLQFAVSSGRCTRGAFMQLIRVKDDFKAELNNCDYILIIDTEGLKSPELAQLDNSYEHDNELATLVVGLSDVTIVNIAMENSTEMKDILQIVVHAFLRMKEIGKKHKCLFVHQNVADVSAHDSNMRDRKFLLDQLNEMTQAAAKMENKLEFNQFTDLMEYDTGTGDHYIPGLWHGNPPMAPVNTGYSESVYDLKKHIMEIFKLNNKPGNINEFLTWTKSFWNAVKFEKFIFSFRNSLVADAYMKLCMVYNKWEWALRKQMHTWALEGETKILNHGKFDTSEKFNIEDVKCKLQSEADAKLKKGEKEMIDKITSYYEQGEGHVELVERYRQDFINSATSLKKELFNLISSKLDAALSRRNGMIKVEGIKNTYMNTMEKEVLELLDDCRKTKSHMSDAALDKAFQNMWQKTVKTLQSFGQQTQNIMSRVLSQLRKNLDARGSGMAQSLDTVNDLNKYGHEKFVVSKGNFFTNLFGFHNKWIKVAQKMVDSLIDDCRQFVKEKRDSRDDYDDTYIREVLNMIDDKLQTHEDLQVNEQSELSLKLHICGFVSRDFQDIHNQFILDNDPLKALEKQKESYCNDFIDLFHKRDQCQKKADEFTKTCIKPALEKYISVVLATHMADEMLCGENSQVFGTRMAFQNSILKNLIEDFKFNRYAHFIESYEKFVKDFILDKVINHFSAENRMFKLEEKLIGIVTSEITKAIEETENQDMKGFIQNICTNLKHRLDFPKDAVDRISSLNNVKTKNIAECLKYSVNEMVTSMKASFQGDIKGKLKVLQEEPQDVLFKRVHGCGKQCPFCKAPCEAGGEAHSKHFLSIHRPEGLGCYRDYNSRKLVTDICTSSVHSQGSFRCHKTQGKWHPYSNYSEIYPDWRIDPDESIEASAYWKYVMTQFNEQFAERYNAEPADIPSAWKSITKAQAEESLK